MKSCKNDVKLCELNVKSCKNDVKVCKNNVNFCEVKNIISPFLQKIFTKKEIRLRRSCQRLSKNLLPNSHTKSLLINFSFDTNNEPDTLKQNFFNK